MRVFVDSSTIIALSRIGELGFLKVAFGKVYITKSVEREILNPAYPETAAIERALGSWIIMAAVRGDARRFRRYGLGEGEASLFLTGKEDLLVIDELNARRLADAEGRPYTGLLGTIAAAAEAGLTSRESALAMLDRLSESSFRMSTPLYREVVRRIRKSDE